MSSAVVIPVWYATLRLHLDKGRQWSVVEHLLLHALSEKSYSVAHLVSAASLPRRLVIEIVIRLMRVGWVELISMKGHYEFRATTAGKRVAKLDLLPAVTRPISRHASFAIDKISGTVFRSWDLTHYTKYRLGKVMEGVNYVMLPEASELDRSFPAPDEIIGTLLDDDEYFRGIDAVGARLMDRYAVVFVHGDTIDGLPSRAPAILRDQVQNAADVRTVTSAKKPLMQKYPSDINEKCHPISFDVRDFVLGGEEHRMALERVLSRSRSHVFIHSTFVDVGQCQRLLPLLTQAVQRGAKIDILWGKSTDADGSNQTAAAIEQCREMLADDLLRKRIRFHRFSTNSHGKLLVADDGRGKMIGIVGSCNWLSTRFESYDVSVILSDTAIVAEIVGHLSAMSIGRNGYWSNLTRDLSGYAVNLRRRKGKRKGQVLAAVVLGAQHNEYILKARDDAKKRILVASHRLGGSAETSVLIPARAAVDREHIDVTILYGRHSGLVSSSMATAMERDAVSSGIRLRRVHRSRLHGKFLVWDDDHAVITSQNWLSSDPPDSSPYGEIGIYLFGSNIGSVLADRAHSALIDDDEQFLGNAPPNGWSEG